MPTLQNHYEIIYYYTLDYQYQSFKRLTIPYKSSSDFNKIDIDKI